jgi:hypothetical protein
MTDPNWEPVMKRAAAIVTNRGGRTCHAAIIARELGIPAVVGCETATDDLADGDGVTVSCAEGDTGNVYAGALEMQVETAVVRPVPEQALIAGIEADQDNRSRERWLRHRDSLLPMRSRVVGPPRRPARIRPAGDVTDAMRAVGADS